MKNYSIIKYFCLLISMTCLGAGYILNGYWLIFIVFYVMGLFWLIMKKRSIFFYASSLLLAYVFLASIGMVINLSPPLMIVGCTMALASWELTLFGQSLISNQLSETTTSLGKYHLQSLSILAGASLLLSLVGLYINLQLSFGFVVILVLLAIGCLSGGIQYFLK